MPTHVTGATGSIDSHVARTHVESGGGMSSHKKDS